MGWKDYLLNLLAEKVNGDGSDLGGSTLLPGSRFPRPDSQDRGMTVRAIASPADVPIENVSKTGNQSESPSK